MKVVKPQRLGLLTRTFENGDRFYFVVTVLQHFSFEHAEPLHEVNLWRFVAAELGAMAPIDACMPKARGEALITGSAFARGGSKEKVVAVRARVGPIDKTLWVIGDREWKLGGVASEPEPFASKKVSWENAFGGEGVASNPIGKGAKPALDKHPLPNVEHPKELVRSPRDVPRPAGLSAIDLTWKERRAKMGTYDRDWLADRFPGFAKDMDWSIWNAAPDDQILPGYFVGDETYAFENMHPERAVVDGRLPGHRARAFVNVAQGSERALKEIATRVDTVHFFPHALRGVILHRGAIEIGEDDAADVGELLVALEDAGTDRGVDHYRAVLEKRLDKRVGAIEALRDDDLMPPVRDRAARAGDAFSDVDAFATSERLVAENMRRGDEARAAALKEELSRRGMAPSVVRLPPREPEPPLDPDRLADFITEQRSLAEDAKRQAETAAREAEARAREACAKMGVDYDAARAKRRRGPPEFSASREIAKLEARGPVAPSLVENMRRAEAEMLAAYRRAAHAMDPGEDVSAEVSARLRASVVRALEVGDALAGRDLTGADLHDLDLSKRDLAGVMLEGADLRGAKLDGAVMKNAVLVDADLRGASLVEASLQGANLGRAKCAEARFDAADLSRAILERTDLSRAVLARAILTRSTLHDAILEGADLSGANAASLLLLRARLAAAKVAGADFSRATLLEVDARGADFRGVVLEKTSFVTTRADDADFEGADMSNFRCVKDSSMTRSNLRGAKLVRANLRGANLDGADFTRADMGTADLSEASCRDAIFKGARAESARFVRADLRGARFDSAMLLNAILQKADMRGASFAGANLFRADLARVLADDATTLDGAHVKEVRVVRRDRARRLDG